MDLVTLKSFDNYFLANIYLTKLQAAGIECYLTDEYSVTINPALGNAIGGIKLIVKKEEMEEALQLIKQSDDDYMKLAKCPKCGATDFTYIIKRSVGNFLPRILVFLLVNTSIPYPTYVYHCGNCGYETESLPESSYSEE